jgi:predicted TIM-barrel fold metal-dependent hydrolase
VDDVMGLRHGIDVVDAHAHFFTADAMKALFNKNRSLDSFQNKTKSRTNLGTIQVPGEDWDTAQMWVNELDRYGIQAMGVMVGKSAIMEFMEAQRRFPDRFFGFANIYPSEPEAPQLVEDAARGGFKGIKLYPSLWNGFRAYDDQCYRVYEEAKRYGLLIVLHFGITLGGSPDLRSGNPLDIHVPSRDFPDLNFVIAHFGAGFFREVLMMQYMADNVYMDSSGSNSWTKYLPYELDLNAVFRRALTAGSPDKILFGTDSTFFPRGWRIKVLEAQLKACLELASEPDPVIDREGIKKIFKENILRLTGFEPKGS